MTASDALEAALEETTGARITSTQRVTGGDIHTALKVVLEGGRSLFVKTSHTAPADLFVREAEGLDWLAEAQALRIPAVIAAPANPRLPPFLALEWIEPGRPGPRFAEELGRGLAVLHQSGADGFGWQRDNYIGSLAQRNDACETWPRFYAERRIAPQVALAREAGTLTRSTSQGLERSIEDMEAYTGPEEPPARLHGDLWNGNLLCDEEGRPCLIDPAVYAGHREMDLAMMRLFGGFDARCFDAYAEAHPLAPGHQERVALYQLYPLLVHVNLFGAGYTASLERALASLGL